MDLGISGRAAIVTGASRGIGLAVAQMLADEGCSVLAVSRRPVDGPWKTLAVDVTSEDAGNIAVKACLENFGRLDILVNNVGFTEPMKFSKLTEQSWRESFDLNFFSAVSMAAAAAPTMIAAGWGRMVHVASVSGREPDELFAPYSAAKAALMNWSKSLSHAYAGKGVLSSCVTPGVTLTELVESNAAKSAERTGSSLDEVMAKQLEIQRVATGRFGDPKEVAAAVVFLASQAASWITGANLEVDGGTLRSV